MQEDVNIERFIGVNSYSSLFKQEKVLSIHYDISKNKKRLHQHMHGCPIVNGH